jgi:hypothetical protein
VRAPHAFRYPQMSAVSRAPAGSAFKLNLSHWAAGSCLGAWVLGRGVPVDLVTGEVAVATGSPAVQVGALGPSYTNGSVANNIWRVRNGPILSNRARYTVVTICTVPSGTTKLNNSPYGERASGGNAILKITGNINSTPGHIGFTYRNDGGTISNIGNAAVDVRDGLPHVLALSGDPGHSLYIDGISRVTNPWSANTTQTGNITTVIGGDPADASGYWVGDISMVATFADAWTPPQHTAFAADPYALIIPAG